MKVFFHFSVTGLSNTYVVGPENGGDAIVVDPGKFDGPLLNLIESHNYYIRAVLLTHGHTSHVQGLRTIRKIYDAEVYYNESEVLGMPAHQLRGGQTETICGFDVRAFDVTGHSSDSLVYHLGDMIFTGDTLFAGTIGKTPNSYAAALLAEALRDSILTLPGRTVILPGHGPPSTIAAEKVANRALMESV